MKRSVKILKFLFFFLLAAVGFAAVGLGFFEGFAGLTLAAPIILAGIETSDDAKVKRSQVWESMNALVAKRKKESRQFTDEEEVEFRKLRQDYDELTSHIEKLEADEKRSLFAAGEKIKMNYQTPSNNINPVGWYNLSTRKSVPVFEKRDRISDVYTGENGKNLSLGRAVRALISGDWTGAELEQRAFSTTSGSGLLVPISTFSTVLDYARAKSVVFAGGARTVLMEDGLMRLARVSQDASLEVKPENDPFSANSMDFSGVNLKAHTIGGVVTLSRELAADAPNTAGAIEQALAGALAAYIDQLALFGLGSTEPTGILETDNINTLALSAPLAYIHLLAAWEKVASANGEPRTIVMAPRERAALAGTTSALGFVEPPELLRQLQWLHSSAIPSNLAPGSESVAFVGDFTKMFVGIRQNAMIEVTTVAGDTFQKHQAAVKLTFRGDVAVEYPGHFCAITGIQAPELVLTTTESL